MHRYACWIIERAEDFSLTLEAGRPLGICGGRCRQHFDSSASFAVGVDRPVHLPHSAHTDLGRHFIRAEASTWSQGQFAWIIRAERWRRAPTPIHTDSWTTCVLRV